MKRMIMLSAVLVGAWALSATGQTAPATKDAKPQVSEVKAATVKQAPKIDGVLDDEAWKSAGTFENFKLPTGKDSKAKTKVYVCQDDKALYIAVECFDDEKAIKTLTAESKEHDDASLWMDDDVELFLEPAPGKGYYQFLINPKGVTGDSFNKSKDDKDAKWDPKYSSAVKVNKDNWTVEFALPWSIFDRSAKFESTWGFNVLRSRQSYGENIYFSPIVGGAHQPEKFGKLTGIVGKAGGAATSGPAGATKPAPATKPAKPEAPAPELEVPMGND